MVDQPLQLTTELDAVNYMLGAIGESPVSSIINTGLPEAVTALLGLRNQSKIVQTRGWRFNTLVKYKVTPDPTTGEMRLPENTAAVRVHPDQRSTYNVRQENNLLYDIDNDTTNFLTTAPTGIYLNITVLKAFETLPESARMYITVKAAKTFQLSTLGAVNLAALQNVDEDEVHNTLIKHESLSADRNLFRDNPQLSRIFRHRKY